MTVKRMLWSELLADEGGKNAKTTLPNADTRITPSNSYEVGEMDSVMFFNDLSWILVQYEGSIAVLQVIVTMKASELFSSQRVQEYGLTLRKIIQHFR